MKHFSRALVAIAVTLSLGSPGSIAQTSSATISGHVVDQTQGIVTNAPKANFFLPGDINFDTALFKNMPIREKFVLQLCVETYNTFNHAEFNGLDSVATFANANSSATPQTGATFGQLNSTLAPRYMQLALRIDF